MSRNNNDISIPIHPSGKTFNKALNEWFSSKYEKSISFNNFVLSNVIDCVKINILDITISEVFDSLNSLKCASSSGHDPIPHILLHNCYWALTKPFHLLFNPSLNV
jgi:hypothetical protein